MLGKILLGKPVVLPAPALVSYDVFDTLIRRIVPAEEVVRRAAHRLARRLGDPSLAGQIHRSRLSFYEDVVWQGEDPPAWPLGLWAAALAQERTESPDLWSDLAETSELEEELEATAPVAGAAAELRALRARGRRVVAISDTWLTEPVLSALLDAHGLHVDAVYTSASHRLSKRRGTLFARVEELEGIPRSRWVHVGDNWKADVAMALLSGIRPWPRLPPPSVVGRPLRRIRDASPDAVEALDRALSNRYPTTTPSPQELGRTLVAPLVLTWLLAVRAESRRHRADQVVFLARDAWLPWEAGKRLAQVLDLPPRRWWRVSRRAVAAAHPTDWLAAGASLPGRIPDAPIGAWLASHGYAGSAGEALLRSAGLTADVPAEVALPRLRDAAAATRDLREAHRADARALLREDFLRLAGDARRSILVDSGWAGTIQDALAFSLGDGHTLHGVYLGLSADGLPSRAGSTKVGLIRDDRAGDFGSALERTAGALRAIDALMREPAPTVARFERVDGVARAVPSDVAPSEADQRFALALRDGVLAGIDEAVAGGLVAAMGLLDQQPEDTQRATLRAVACGLSRRLLVHPPDWASELVLGVGVDEGAAAGARGGLDASQDLRRAWWPAVVSRAGLRPLLPALERAGEVALTLRSGRRE